MKQTGRSGRSIALIVFIALLAVIMPRLALAESYSAVVMNGPVNVYAEGGLSTHIGTLQNGCVITVESTEFNIAFISYMGRYGYIDVTGVTAVTDVAKPAHVNASGVKVYKTASTSSDSYSVSKGTKVNVIAVSGNWALIERGGVGAFMYAGYLTYESDQPANTPAPVDSGVGDAPRIVDEVPAMVSADGLKVYKSASASSQYLGSLSYGETVTVMAYNNTWAYIEKGGRYGYCKVSGLVKIANATPAPSNSDVVNPVDIIPATVIADSVNVYSSASASSEKLGALKKGARVNVVAYNATWAYIEGGGRYGFCYIRALTPTAKLQTAAPAQTMAEKFRPKYPDIKFTATAIYDYAPVYTVDTSSPAYIVNIGRQVDVYAYNSTWAYIGMGDSRGFMYIKHLSAATYTELAAGDSGANVMKMQAALEKLGYFDAVPGGNFSTQTALAVKRFQSAIGAVQTGAADIAMLRALYGGFAPECALISTDIAYNSRGAHVERVQTRLTNLGYLIKSTSVDGDFGATTLNAVKLFQGEAGLVADGALSVATLKALYANSAPKLPSTKYAADYVSFTPGSVTSGSGVTSMPAGLASSSSSLPSNATTAQKIEYVIYLAQNQLGKPYIYGTAGPNSFDCSGFTTYCYKKVNVSLGRSAYAQGYTNTSGTQISSITDLIRGDIVCFDTISDSDVSDHVGIYLGNGYFIHASSGTGNGKQVCISSLSSGYYNRVFSWGRRPLE